MLSHANLLFSSGIFCTRWALLSLIKAKIIYEGGMVIFY